jgi:hypothetical protein
MTEIFLTIEGNVEPVRSAIVELEAALGDTGRVRAPHPVDGNGSQFTTIYVDVFGVESEADALLHIQPLLSRRFLDMLRYGTTVMQWVVPAPPPVVRPS